MFIWLQRLEAMPMLIILKWSFTGTRLYQLLPCPKLFGIYYSRLDGGRRLFGGRDSSWWGCRVSCGAYDSHASLFRPSCPFEISCFSYCGLDLQRLNEHQSAKENGYVGVGKEVEMEPDISPSLAYASPPGSVNVHHSDADVKSFFFESDLHEGSKMKLSFPKIKNSAKFLPRQVSESIPFSTTKLPEILAHFSMKSKSLQAKAMEDTLKVCEAPALNGEDKYCATSLESLVDFGVSKLGNQIKIISPTQVQREDPHVYTIGRGTKMIGDKSVECHKLNYVYAVFYCHEVQGTRAYRVPLKQQLQQQREDGDVALAVCHSDTSAWNPKNEAFQQLKVKPGTVPICHFLSSDTLFLVNK
nr:BURP domain-containing protein 5-like isoform X1 [Ziziphus jujuba var. spinosa]XP_048322240.1 BURP domain-containing protein 5-like isoform X2 [Ziziphus jujuba var. spinosa]